MSWFHFRHRRNLGLLAASALDEKGREARLLRDHLQACASCRLEFEGLSRIHEALRRDAAAVMERPLPISSGSLRTRVLAVARAGARPAPEPEFGLRQALPALALVGFGLVLGQLVHRAAPPSPTVDLALAGAESRNETLVNNTAFYERLEKTHLRANAARYLADAQDVLIQVTAAADCPDSPLDNVDVRQEAQTSRSLLRRRAALVSGSGETLSAARGVMEEVEGVLQQVADLPQCTRRTDVDAIAKKVDRRKLLMKIDMVAQELAAP